MRKTRLKLTDEAGNVQTLDLGMQCNVKRYLKNGCFRVSMSKQPIGIKQVISHFDRAEIEAIVKREEQKGFCVEEPIKQFSATLAD